MKRDLLRKVCWIGDEYVGGRIKAVVLRFAGLGAATMKDCPDYQEHEWASRGALLVGPFHNPWAWMNDKTVHFTDQVVAATISCLRLPKDIPIIATGGSMGGHAALMYTIKSEHPIAACYALSPVCDLLFHYNERPDLPRTLHDAFESYHDIKGRLISNSPLHQAHRFPDIPYLIVHGTKDKAVSKQHHSDKFVASLCRKSREVNYIEDQEMAHCGPFRWSQLRAINDFMERAMNARNTNRQRPK